jgi:mono/diheme cytochrome c family protein
MVVRCAVGYALFALVCGLFSAAGCGGPKVDTSEMSPEVLYQQHCAKCHARAGEPGGPGIGGSRGPDISKIGQERDADWLFAYVRNPLSVKPKAQGARLMPAFEGTLTDEQIRALAVWLAAKK